jgi:enoyl-CoA hydratase
MSAVPLVTYEFSDGISTISMEDGKANVMSLEMIAGINAALDQAEGNGGVVIITGRDKMFSAGFDLGVFKSGDSEQTFSMLSGGARLSERLLSFPLPTFAACSGHAIAMGCFLLMSTDYRIGIEGDSKFAANEVAIGMTVPHFAIRALRQRLTPQQLNKAINFAYYFSAQEAVQAGFLDELCSSADQLTEAAKTRASDALKLDAAAHFSSKLRLRETLLQEIARDIERDCEGWRASS